MNIGREVLLLLGEMGTDTLVMLKATYNDAMEKTQVFEWVFLFKSGEMSINDQYCYGHPLTVEPTIISKKFVKSS